MFDNKFQMTNVMAEILLEFTANKYKINQIQGLLTDTNQTNLCHNSNQNVMMKDRGSRIEEIDKETQSWFANHGFKRVW